MLAAGGRAVDLSKWDEGFVPEKKDKKPAFTVPITGANYVAPKTPRPPRKPSVQAAPIAAPVENGQKLISVSMRCSL